MNAMNLYLQACRYVLEADLHNNGIWIDISKHLSSIRLVLTCCVCGGLLKRPMGSPGSVCHHYVCKDCIGGKMRYIKRGCGWCKSYEDFVVNDQMEAIVRCFQQLCRYLHSKAAYLFQSPTLDANVSSILGIIKEATADRDLERSGGSVAAGDSTVDAPRQLYTNKQSASRKRRKKLSSSNTEEDEDSDKEICFKFKQSKYDSFRSVEPSCDVIANGDRNFHSSMQVRTVKSSTDETSYFTDRKTYYGKQKSGGTMGYHDGGQAETATCDSSFDEKKTDNFVLAEHDYNKCTEEEATAADTSATYSARSVEDEESAPKKTTATSTTREPADVSGLLNRRSKYVSVRERPTINQILATSSDGGMVTGEDNVSTKELRGSSSGRRCKVKGKFGCRCALATPNPGKLTCCGQRCPCYASFKGCNNCKCRGCRNPRGDPRNIPATLLRPVGTSQMLASTPHNVLNKINSTVT